MANRKLSGKKSQRKPQHAGRQPFGAISINFTGKRLQTLQDLIFPIIRQQHTSLLIANPLPASLVNRLTNWLTGFNFSLKEAKDKAKTVSHTLYITPAGFRAFIWDGQIRLEKQFTKRQLEQQEARLDTALHDLNERIKEQTCLYSITKLAAAGPDVEELLQGVVSLIPPGWQYPEHSCCQIRYGKQKFSSTGFRKSSWNMVVRRTAADGNEFTITVYYKKKMPESDEGPFLKNERSLLNSIADSLLVYISQVLVKNKSRMSERMLKEAQDLALLANWNYDLVNKKNYWSDSIYTIFGVKMKKTPEAFGSFFKLVVPADRKRVEATMRMARQDGTPFSMEYGIKTLAGEKKYIEEYGYCEKDKKGQVVRLFGTVQDITARKKTEIALLDSDTNYRTLFETSPLPSYIFRLSDFRIMDVNNRMVIHYGYSKEELMRMTILDLRPEDQVPVLLQTLETEKYSREPVSFGIFTHLHKQGTKMQMEITGQRVNYQGENALLVLAVDVTDKLLRFETEKLEREVIEASISGMQDIRNLLGKYISGLEQLFPDCKASLLRVQDGHLYNLVAQSLPETYAAAIEGIEIGPSVGSCGTAAFEKKLIIVSNIAKDPLWKQFKKAAADAGLKACWSFPIFNDKGNVIATFASYFSTPRNPTSSELEFFTRAGSVITIILENHEKEQRLQVSYERFEYVTKATSDAIWDWNLITNKTFCGEGFTWILGEGLTEDQWNLDVWLGFTHPEDRQLIIHTVEHAISGTENRWEHEYRVQRADGKYAFVSDRAYIIRDQKGKPIRIIGAIRDITAKKEEEERLQLFESVVTNTNDAVLITLAEPISDNGPEIIYVNEAFTRMTGYTAEEVLHKTPRILQGPKSDWAALSRLKLALKRGEACELSTINYAKDGSEFRVEIAVKPVNDENGKLTHFFAIQRDITQPFRQQRQIRLMEIVSNTFKKNESLVTSLGIVLKKLVEFGDFTAAETWLLSPDKKHFNLVANFASTKEARDYYLQNKSLNTLTPDGGLLKEIWTRRELVIADDFDKHPTLRRREGVQKAGFKSAVAIPLLYNGELIGALTVLTDKKADHLYEFEQLFKGLESDLGSEVKRKQLENELSIIFNTVPDIIAVAGFDGYFKRINPAASVILGYSTAELLSRPYNEFIHPDFIPATTAVTEGFSDLNGSNYFENCYISKTGKKVWLAWTYQKLPEENLVFSVAKDITRQKELQRLLSDATNLARIGAWEMDMATGQINWSDVTREIHEVPSDYQPELEGIYQFYRESDKIRLNECVKNAIEKGASYDVELLHVTARGNERWVRVIGTPEFSNGNCTRLYGSFQDIHATKLADIELKQRTRYLSAIATVAQIFLSNENWFDGIKNSFDLARYTIMADQIFYKEIYTDKQTGQSVYRQRIGWLKGEEQPQIDPVDIQIMPVDLFPEVKDVLLSDQHYTAVLSELPDNLLRQVLVQSGIKSVLFLPVFTGTVLEGVVGIEECTYERRWADGEIFFMRSLCSSLSSAIQRFRSKAALNEILAEKSEILESIGDGFFAVDKNWIVNYWNKQAEMITRITKEEILGRELWEKFPRKQETPGNKALLNAMQTGEKTAFEMFFIPLGIWVEGSIYPTRHGLTTYFKDVTTRKAAQEELRISNERFEIVSEATNDAIRDWDIKNDVAYWGKGYNKLFGHTEVKYQPALELWTGKIHPEERNAVKDILSIALKDPGQLSWSAEYRYQQADGNYAWVFDRGIIMRDVLGSPYRLVGSLSDITYQKEYEKSLKKLNENLEKQTHELMISNAELEQFAYVASHDLQEPLRMITSFMTKLETRYASQLDERGRKYIGFAADGANRMRQNILGLLQYSRVGKGDAAIEEIDLRIVMEEICLLHQTDINECGADIQVADLPVINNYMAPVVQLMNNLVSNALKYRKPDTAPVIRISARPIEGFWEIAVSDNGIGIEKDYLQKIFVIFQRLHLKDQYEGTGIGLAVVKKIVENLGGKVWVESTPGQGSTFYFTIRSVKD